MWYASIWIFTLKNSWQSGANLFKNNLIDWCPASNTLGWRWVAGLQTFGKNYIARVENIKTFTNNRFNPVDQLQENPNPIEFENINSEAISIVPKEIIKFEKLENLGLILNNNDLSLNILLDNQKIPFEVCVYYNKKVNSLKSNLVCDFEKDLFDSIMSEYDNFEYAEDYEHLVVWAKKRKLKNLIFPYETIGNKILNDRHLLDKLEKEGINYIFYLRDWDSFAFPFANKGFFSFKKKIPEFLKYNKIVRY